jgi:hypothetical protein
MFGRIDPVLSAGKNRDRTGCERWRDARQHRCRARDQTRRQIPLHIGRGSAVR